MQNVDHNIGFGEKRQFVAENCQKSQKIMIITSTPEVYKPFTKRYLFLTRICVSNLNFPKCSLQIQCPNPPLALLNIFTRCRINQKILPPSDVEYGRRCCFLYFGFAAALRNQSSCTQATLTRSHPQRHMHVFNSVSQSPSHSLPLSLSPSLAMSLSHTLTHPNTQKVAQQNSKIGRAKACSC
jgi:hypothetical protein